MSQSNKVLVTGGAGYIGSHVCVALIEAGFEPIIIDNFCNSSPLVLERIATISGVKPVLYQADINDVVALQRIFDEHDITAVMHFAGLKAVGESTEIPLSYYRANVAGSIALFEAMAANQVWSLIFSSSATVYGNPKSVPIDEGFPCSATNPYGRSKLIVEDILRDLSAAPGADWKISLLRYFNPIGAHSSGLIGENPNGIPNNLLPFVSQVAIGRLPQLKVFGDDYDTLDGTGVRDYIHVVDLALGHVAALQQLRSSTPACQVYNLGTGVGYSVLQIINAFSQASGVEIPYSIEPRRAGDIAECYAKPDLALSELGWKAERGLTEMMQDTWRWQKSNPKGY
ncbi:UDP-glucose 4-epimerase GalE [Gilvimarinus polysaccharolyticus]|uniref:UDP-glucose 4-epimerase GalE n=1 Tax=Gilvimarinus polysaccharolyticus TaxID=863921 RepID=UPI00067349D6|nr:UDP-glucose 4-epimerase GalE [Gilvimarinus polysaccharolyticus]